MTVEQPKAVSRMRSVFPLGRLRDNRRRPPRPRRSRADRRRSAAAPCARQAPLADANSRDSSVANATNAVSPRGLHAAWQQRPAIRRRQPRPRSSPKHPSLASRFSCRNLATLCEDAPPVAVRTVTEKSRFRRFGAIGSACFESVVALNFLRGRATRPSCCMSSSTRRRVHAMPAGL